MNKSGELKKILSEYTQKFVTICFDKRKNYQRIRVYFFSKEPYLWRDGDIKQQIVDDIEASFNATYIEIENLTYGCPCGAHLEGFKLSQAVAVTFRLHSN